VLFGAAVSEGALAKAQADLANVVIAVSMMLMPVLFAGSEKFLLPRLGPRKKPPIYDKIDDTDAAVIICGFGRVGQVVGRVLRMQGIRFTALDEDSAQVEVVRRFGNKVYFGNPARADVLRAAGAEKAKVLVIALDHVDATNEVAALARREFRHLAIFARARNRHHAHQLMEIGIDGIIRETFFSSLHLSELVLEKLDVPPDAARRAIEIFRAHDERNLLATRGIAGDETQLIQSAQDAAEELREVFEADPVTRATPSIPAPQR
jgi:CPA2 family monovalent cation:H+ antiporter-2/glutathione-regulated potassium-efflux system protein KefB